MKYSDFAAEVGRFLGLGRDPVKWTGPRAADIAAAVNAGLRQFYTPPPVPLGHQQVMTVHRWSFLEPQAEMTLTADDDTFTMPDDFGGINGKITFAKDQELERQNEIVICPIGQINKELQRPNGTEKRQPIFAALLPVQEAVTNSQKWTMKVWPMPEKDYIINFCYRVIPVALASDKYPYGGDLHSETMLASMLCIAEERYTEPVTPGVMRARFIESLKGSIEIDRQLRKPQSFGYFGDSSDLRERDRNNRRDHSSRAYVSYNGNFYP